jgi:hypothetical protein
MPATLILWFVILWAAACLLLASLVRRKILAVYPDFFDEADQQRWLGSLRRKSFSWSMILDTDLPGDWVEFGPFVKYGLYAVRTMMALFFPLIMALGYLSH